MANNYFKFKQFAINQSDCAMKVGTDGVLLGAWGDVKSVGECRVLDIGAGTGVVSLIIAQRNALALVDSIEIDEKSALQCSDNFSKSCWSDRLVVINKPIQIFAEQNKVKYDYVFSNPPYFNNSLKNSDDAKSTARHTDSLSYDDLASSVNSLLSDTGSFSAIFPYVESGIFVAIASQYGLYCNRRLEVRGSSAKPIKRVLMTFTREKGAVCNTELMDIELGERHVYSEKYIELTKQYYLKF